MAITNVLVHVDDSKSVESRIAVAIDLAGTHDAHLTAIYAMRDALNFPYATGEYVSAEFIESQIEFAKEAAASAKAQIVWPSILLQSFTKEKPYMV